MMIYSLKPKEAFSALQADSSAMLIDVRDQLEFNFIGHPLNASNLPWKIWSNCAWSANPDFLAQVYSLAPDKETPIFLLCRSGQRSLEAANTLAEHGYSHLTNIEEGFEGSLDNNKHRSAVGGWRFHGLPWEQG